MEKLAELEGQIRDFEDRDCPAGNSQHPKPILSENRSCLLPRRPLGYPNSGLNFLYACPRRLRGRIGLESPFITSQFGDEGLYLQYQSRK